MTSQQALQSALCVALLLGAAPVKAAPAEPLIVSQLADPDPGYVPPPSEERSRKRPRSADQTPALDAAMQEFGRAIGAAAMVEQRAIAARCQTAEPPANGAADRFAWEASCRYSRH